MAVSSCIQRRTINSGKLKGIEPVISTILIIGILAAAAGAAYQWGMPIMQKNVDKTSLYSSENFINELDKKIDGVAKNGGSDELVFSAPGMIKVMPQEDRIEFTLETEGSIYAPGGFVCLSRDCDLNAGIWGEDEYSARGVEVAQTNDRYAVTKYSLIMRNLTKDGNIYMRDIITLANATITSGQGSRIIITKAGETRGDIKRTLIKIDLV